MQKSVLISNSRTAWPILKCYCHFEFLRQLPSEYLAKNKQTNKQTNTHTHTQKKQNKQTNERTNKTSVLPVARMHCILASKFAHRLFFFFFFFFFFKCVNSKTKIAEKNTNRFFDLKMLKTSYMIIW